MTTVHSPHVCPKDFFGDSLLHHGNNPLEKKPPSAYLSASSMSNAALYGAAKVLRQPSFQSTTYFRRVWQSYLLRQAFAIVEGRADYSRPHPRAAEVLPAVVHFGINAGERKIPLVLEQQESSPDYTLHCEARGSRYYWLRKGRFSAIG